MARPKKLTISNLFLKELNQLRQKRKRDQKLTRITLLCPQIDQKVFEELIFCDGYNIELKIEYKKKQKKSKVGRK